MALILDLFAQAVQMLLVLVVAPLLIASRLENSIPTLPSLQPAAPTQHIQRFGGLFYFPRGKMVREAAFAMVLQAIR